MEIHGHGPLNFSPELLAARTARLDSVHEALHKGMVPLAGMAPEEIAASRSYCGRAMGDIQSLRSCCSFPSLPDFGFPSMPGTDPFGMGFGQDMFGMGMGPMGMMGPNPMMMMMLMQQQDFMMMLLMLLMAQMQQNQGPPCDHDHDHGDVEDPGDVEGPPDVEDPGDVEEPGDTEEPGDVEEPGDTEEPDDPDKPEEPRMDPVRAATLLIQNFDLLDQAAGIGRKDGIVGVPDLRAVLDSPDAPPELREAARFFLDNPMYLNALDIAAHGGRTDGKISRDDLSKFLSDVAKPGGGEEGEEEKMDPARAAAILTNNFQLLDTAAGIGRRDGIIGRQDLEAVANNPDAPAELKEAVRFFLENPLYLNNLDVAAHGGRADGKVSQDDLSSFIEDHG